MNALRYVAAGIIAGFLPSISWPGARGPTFHAVFPVVVGYPAGLTVGPARDEPNVVCWKWDPA